MTSTWRRAEFSPSRPVLSYLMEMNSGSRKPFSASNSFALSKASERHVHSMLESFGTSASITQYCSNKPSAVTPTICGCGRQRVDHCLPFRGCAAGFKNDNRLSKPPLLQCHVCESWLVHRMATAFADHSRRARRYMYSAKTRDLRSMRCVRSVWGWECGAWMAGCPGVFFAVVRCRPPSD